MSPALVDLTGQTFGTLTVLGQGDRSRSGRVTWLCQCSCGSTITALSCNLRGGNTRSCGCRRKEALSKARTTHGATRGYRRTTEYAAWRNAKQRCFNPNNPNWRYYGGRGITIDPLWLGPDGFERFLEELGPKPSADMSLDRIDVDGNYEPGNCRWADASTQSANRRPWKKRGPV